MKNIVDDPAKYAESDEILHLEAFSACKVYTPRNSLLLKKLEKTEVSIDPKIADVLVSEKLSHDFSYGV